MRSIYDLQGYTLALIFTLAALVFYSCVARADDPPPSCEQVLAACDQDAQRLKKQVEGLKGDVKFWKGEAAKRNGEDSFVLTVALGAAAGALGGVAADGKTGLAPGGIVGLAVGTIVGLIRR